MYGRWQGVLGVWSGGEGEEGYMAKVEGEREGGGRHGKRPSGSTSFGLSGLHWFGAMYQEKNLVKMIYVPPSKYEIDVQFRPCSFMCREFRLLGKESSQ